MGLTKKIKKTIKYFLKGAPDLYTSVEVKIADSKNMLKNRNVLITGGSRGIGFAIAKKCLSEGATVIITGRDKDGLIKACRELGNNSYYFVMDVTDTKSFKNLFSMLEEKFSIDKIDSLISNAGISLHEKSFREVSEENWDSQFNTNLKGNYFLVKEFVKYLEQKENKKGNIVVISSERAQRPDSIPYGLTKVATNSFVKAMAVDLIKNDIRINSVAPGVTASDMTGFDKNNNLYAEWQPTKRIFVPEEIAEVVNFLLSDISACISGEIINCDLGKYILKW